jgi:predicted nucleotidyltransferase
MSPNEQQVNGLVHQIVEAVHPLRIILFGSAARGEAGPESDLDVLVVMPEGTNHIETLGFLHTQFHGLSFGVDIVIATPSQLLRYRDDIGFIYYDALREGKELYAAAA